MLTYDWKHLAWEDYDQWLFGKSTGILADSHLTDSPAVILIQAGLHSCFHGLPPEISKPNYNFLDAELKNIERLMWNVHDALRRVNSLGRWPAVIFVTSGRIFRWAANDDQTLHLHNCTSVFNKRIKTLATKYQFAVLDREEIEHRILYKYEHDKVDHVLAPAIHEPFPIPQIVSTALLALLACLINGDYGRR